MNLLIEGSGWILDVVFFVVILLGILIGACRGFVKGLLKTAGWLFALAFAFFFCMPLRAALEDNFGLTTKLAEAIGGFKVIADVLTIVISFAALVFVVKLAAWLLGKLGTNLVNNSKFLGGLNRFLGALLGLVKALVLLFILLMLAKWLENWLTLDALGNYIRSSFVVGKIYDWEWFVRATSAPGALLTQANVAFLPLR